MHRLVSSATTSISERSAAISLSREPVSVSAACMVRHSSSSRSLSATSALKASRNRALISSSVRCGVWHFSSPVNLLLHRQIVRRYLSVECQTLEPK